MSGLLASDYAGHPRVYSVLAAYFHCEALAPKHAPMLEAANRHVINWIGAELHWTNAEFIEGIEPFRITDTNYIAGYAATALTPPPGDAITKDFSKVCDFGRQAYNIEFGSGEKATETGPYGYGFWAERSSDDVFCVLRCAVPDDTEPAVFRSRVLEIAAELPLLWASAGYSYSFWWGYDAGGTHDRTIHAHARRYCGYDIPEYVGEATTLSRAVRSVNWLTLLGPTFLEALPDVDASRLPGVISQPLGGRSQGGICLQAGLRPEMGDRNRMQIPAAYRAVDAFIQPVRAGGEVGRGNLILLGDPWTEDETCQWLQRFGRGGVLPAPREDDAF